MIKLQHITSWRGCGIANCVEGSNVLARANAKKLADSWGAGILGWQSANWVTKSPGLVSLRQKGSIEKSTNRWIDPFFLRRIFGTPTMDELQWFFCPRQIHKDALTSLSDVFSTSFQHVSIPFHLRIMESWHIFGSRGVVDFRQLRSFLLPLKLFARGGPERPTLAVRVGALAETLEGFECMASFFGHRIFILSYGNLWYACQYWFNTWDIQCVPI